MVLRSLIVAALVAAGVAGAQPQSGLVVGHSVRGRTILAYERGDRSAPVTLVVGVIHGTEPAGLAVIRRLRTMPLPAGVHLWLVPTVNPDGLAAGTRQNAHGVDLNRNWPVAWVHNGVPWDGYYSGPRPMSERENRAMRAFILRVKPALTIWYHQPLDEVYGSDPHVAVLKRYARLTGLPYRRLVAPRGAATRWERKRFPRGAHFVVEFPAGRISAATARRHAAAVIALAKDLQTGAAPQPAAKSGPVALVTSETENQLLVVDLGSGAVIRRLKMPPDPQNVETTPANGAGAVVSTSGAVTLLSLPRLRIRRTIRAFNEPHIAAFSPNGRYLYVTDDARGELVVIGVRRGRVLRRIFVGRGAHHIAVRPDGKRLWIVLGERATEIVVVNTRRPTRPWIVARLFDIGGLAHDAAFAPGGKRVWVTYDDRSTIAIFDARTYRQVHLLPCGPPPQHVSFSHYAYVTSGNDGRLRIFSLTGRLHAVAHTPAGSFNIGLGGGLVLTPSLTRGTLTQFRGGSGHLIWSRKVAPAARDAAYAVLP